MLVLSRRALESIVIGSGAEKITITVCEVRGEKVRIGIDAPRSMIVDRAEVAERRVERREVFRQAAERG